MRIVTGTRTPLQTVLGVTYEAREGGQAGFDRWPPFGLLIDSVTDEPRRRLLLKSQDPRASNHLFFESGDISKLTNSANACARLKFQSSREHQPRFFNPAGQGKRLRLADNDHAKSRIGLGALSPPRRGLVVTLLLQSRDAERQMCGIQQRVERAQS